MSPAVRVLGKTQLRRADDGVVVDADAVPTTKALDLLRLLAADERSQRGADYYISVLWPAADEARGRSSLRTAVAQLRRILGPDAIRRSGDLLGLGAVDTDVSQLRLGAVQVEELRRSREDSELVRLVQSLEDSCGADLVISSASCEAVYAARQELRELRCRVLLSGAEAASRLGWARESLELAQRADELIPTETSGRALMTAWAAVGETERVVETFERLRAHLDATYGVQPSPASRALYLQVVTAGEGLTLGPVEHHREQVSELARTILLLARRRHPGGVVWVLGEPGSGRDSVARRAVQLVAESAPDVARSVEVLLEVVGLDEAQQERVKRRATDQGHILVVPIRRPVPATTSPQEAQVLVPVLKRSEFRDLLTQLLQEHPTGALEQQLWATTGGLAGHACRTVGDLVRGDGLRWMPGSVDLARCGSRSPRTPYAASPPAPLPRGRPAPSGSNRLVEQRRGH